ncbi:MAG: hypothetical protein M1837_004004 [Sclerophora amabilis]|nr:MAG: hypothetical protein M1837_004004 [Sclerophora amabilis]
MAFDMGIGDLLAVTKLAWDLYHNCFLVAREAPEDFRQLVNELASLQGVLRTLRDDVNSDKSFLEKLGESKKDMLERCLGGCYDTLKKLEELVTKYRQLGIGGDGMQFWRKIKWVTQQRDISNLRAKVMIHTCNLSLCMSSIGNSSLARIETSMVAALERQQVSQEQGQEEPVTPQTRTRSIDVNETPPKGLAINGLQRVMTESTLVERPAARSPESTPSMSEEDTSEFGPSSMTTPTVSRKISMNSRTPGTKRSQPQYDYKDLPPSPRSSEEGFQNQKKSISEVSIASPDPANNDKSAPGVLEVVHEAMKELSRIRQREQSSRPLRIVPQDTLHKPDDSLKEKFQELANDELKVRRLNARDWLRVATWWLLKARNNMDLHERPAMTNARGSFSRSDDSRSPSNQAYVDLLKSSWILYDVILKDENLTTLLTDENRKLFYNLSDAINEDFFLFKPVDVPDQQTLLRQNLNIWELLQPEEESFEDENLMPGLENGRWITVEHEDAGEEDEHVLLRTFVNAEIGSKALRIKSRGAPYLLLLSVKEGESEPKVTITNQSGTFGMTRNFTNEDLTEFKNPSSPVSPQIGMSASSMGAVQPIPMHFGRMKISVVFTSDADLERFKTIPDSYFNSVKLREPRQMSNATESLVFESSVEVYEVLKASTMKSTVPRQQWTSCNIRILETTGKVGWKTTRRLVVSSSAKERRPWCTSTFLPLSRVQVSKDNSSRQMLMKWSDCTHEVIQTDGSWNNMYSYVYDDANPNVAICLQFCTEQEALDFEKSILRLSLQPVYEWSMGLDERFVYNVCDIEPDPKSYKALMITHCHMNWKYSELFYSECPVLLEGYVNHEVAERLVVYRDTDYQYSHARTSARFPQVYYTDYVSNHVEKLYKPPTDAQPLFSHCTKKVGFKLIEFEDENVAQQFMNSLTSNYALLFSRRVHWITTKPPPRFGSTKSSKGNSEVQLWRKGQSTKLVSRWEDTIDDKWMTMTIPRTTDGLRNMKDSNRAILPKTEYERGRLIDMANLVARSPREASVAKKIGPVTIAFESVRDREEFVEALEGSSDRGLRRYTSNIDELLGVSF